MTSNSRPASPDLRKFTIPSSPSATPAGSHQLGSHVWHSRTYGLIKGAMMVLRPLNVRGMKDVPRTGTRRDLAAQDDLGSGYRYLMESIAAGDGAVGTSSSLTRYYAESGTPPGVFLGAGLAALDGGRGVEKGSPATEQHLFNLLGMCADPVTGNALGRQPNRPISPRQHEVTERTGANPRSEIDAERSGRGARTEAEERARETRPGHQWPDSTSPPPPPNRCPWHGRWPIGIPRRRSTRATAGPSRSS